MYKVLVTTFEGMPCGMLLHQGKLVEIRFGLEDSKAVPGDLHAAQVRDIVDGLGAAFLEVGLDRTGMLPLKTSRGQKLKLKTGQRLLVRIVRDAAGNKGARLSTELSLPGLGLVLYPGLQRITFSKKIADDAVRKEFSQFLTEHKSDDMGVLVRTAAVTMSKEQLLSELEYLSQCWQSIEREAEANPVPRRVFAVSSLTRQIEREWLSKTVSEVWVETASMKKEFERILSQPWMSGEIVLHEAPDNRSLRRFFKLGKALDRIRYSKLWLPSGGSIVIETTEAMTVIDVNSGKFGGKAKHRSTAMKVNEEACIAIAEQARLRGIVGIIVVDFIDMEANEERRELHQKMEKLLYDDPARTRVLPLTAIGLMQITRQRTGVGGGQEEAIQCEQCRGTGKKSRFAGVMESLIDDVWAMKQGAGDSIQEIQVTARPDVERHIRASGVLEQLDGLLDCPIRLGEHDELEGKLYQVRVV